MRNPHEVLIKPVVTEKTTNLMEENKYTFEVDRDANKIEIKHAVESIFKVNVVDVKTLTVKSKPKRMGKYVGRTSSWKKAIVTLKPGERLPIFEG
ncbi:MAG: 50S ribosomal protein L23 [Bacillota bacterium]|jgi:large subunit ribosomal protein L23|uniref:Large ribosomal subunit protein uL23 n=1 Tax=Thermanaerosceptrum fracticalcis TaxID=1712410 RepID=A0A7G6E5U1_THEFR|nr:50S ribosomal protein L23 [Thermanaerosceptrum fracticalcis]QNB47445.1 50S ribosomal protein L23 [Thermanaerosceptrum fracticalcis]